jgi:flagellar motor switch protein FliN/FliY
MGDPNKMKSGASKPGQGSAGAGSEIQGTGPADKSASQKSNMDFILDIPLEISVELGRTTLMINDLLKLGQGSVVELSKIAGETLEVLANQRLIARGEVVVINEKYGIRLTEIISPMERIERLR